VRPLIEAFSKVVEKIKGVEYIDEDTLRDVVRELQRSLLRADVSIQIAKEITDGITSRVRERPPPPGIPLKEYVLYVLYEELVKSIGGEERPRVEIKKLPYVAMFVGVEGCGKTTTLAKIGKFYARRGLRVGLVETDVHRPAAYEQLEQLAERINALFYGERDSEDPIGIAKRGVEALIKAGAQLVLVDTAGRHRNEVELMEEVKRIYEAIKPDEVVLVIDATIGKQALAQAEAFSRYIPISSIVLTKMDSTARGGGALMAIAKTKAKVKFIGVGEDIDDLEVFDPQSFVSRLLGFGDMKALVERVRDSLAEEEVLKELEQGGKFTLYTFMRQIEALLRAGPLGKLLQLLPSSIVSQISDDQLQLSQQKLRRWLAIMKSMTKEELMDPSILNYSRIKRIALGSGTSVKEVREMLKAYEAAKSMMGSLKRLRRRGLGVKGLRI